MAHIGNGKHSARTILEGEIEEGERAPLICPHGLSQKPERGW
jgi:hypothetical protein